jgi:hypothetical protein
VTNFHFIFLVGSYIGTVPEEGTHFPVQQRYPHTVISITESAVNSFTRGLSFQFPSCLHPMKHHNPCREAAAKTAPRPLHHRSLDTMNPVHHHPERLFDLAPQRTLYHFLRMVISDMREPFVKSLALHHDNSHPRRRSKVSHSSSL